MSWFKLGGYILIIIPTLFLGIVLGFYLIQDYMIFLGEKLPESHRFVFKAAFREVNFSLPSGQTINALHFTAKEAKGLIYYHHGNAGNLQGWGRMASTFLNIGYDVLIYDYRGYGKSTGRIRQQQELHSDAEFILESFLKEHNYDRVVYHGTSLGSGIAAKLAVSHPPAALILETPYYNFLELIHYHYPYLPAGILSKYTFRTDRFLKQLKCPILLIHGTDDKIVPYEASVKLAEIRKDIKLLTIRNGVHNNLTDFETYHREVRSFLEGLK